MEAAGTVITAKMQDTFFTHPKSTGGIVYEITVRED